MTYFNILLNLYYEINIFKGSNSNSFYELQCHYYNYGSYKIIINIQNTLTRDFAHVYMRNKLKKHKNTFHRDGKFINEY